MRAMIVTALVAMFAAASLAAAEERSVALTDVTVVRDENEFGRVFFRLAEFPFSTNMVIEEAILTVPFTGEQEARVLELRVSPVTEAWSRGAAEWDTPHDVHLSSACRVDLNAGSGVAIFDVMVSLKEVLEDGMVADGFVLLAHSPARALSADDLARLGSPSGAELRLTTTVLPSGRPPQRWLDRQGN